MPSYSMARNISNMVSFPKRFFKSYLAHVCFWYEQETNSLLSRWQPLILLLNRGSGYRFPPKLQGSNNLTLPLPTDIENPHFSSLFLT